MGNSHFDGLHRRWDRVHTYLWVAGNEGMEKNMETIIIRIGLGFRKNGKENGNYENAVYRDNYKDPFLHS